MDWLQRYQLVLLDFDGLLVNTEELHFKAYQRMLQGRGETLSWSFPRYCLAAHHSSTGLRDQIYEEYPALYREEPRWDVLYAEKKAAYGQLLAEGHVAMMPGAGMFLDALQDTGTKHCVVTNSHHDVVAMIREQLPALESIPVWLTREDYSSAKPDPECYRCAVKRLGEPGDRLIGFEDSARGIAALQGTSAKPVLVCEDEFPGIEDLKADGVLHIPNFNHLLQAQDIGL